MDESINTTPLRILMTTDTVGGVWSYSVELCKSLQPFGVHFHLVTTGAPVQPKQRAEVENLPNVTLYETDFLLEWMERPWQSIDASAAWLLNLEKELQPHLIHINGFVYGSLQWQVPKLVVAHSDVFSWWQSVKGENPTSDWNEYFNRVSAGLKAADYLIAPSGWMLDRVKKIYGTEVSGEAIYNGRSATQFHPGIKEKKVLSMGRIWDEAKNIQLLVKAAAEIDYPVLLAGEAHFEHNDTATEGANVQYLGKLSTAEVASQLSTAAVYVLPAKYEPFGLSVLEAALSGCALVLGNIETLKEIWGDAALYVDTDDAEALAATVNSLLENEFLLTLYAETAQQRAVQYRTEKMAERYWEVYRKMVKQQ